MAQYVRRYELCAENHCEVRNNPKDNETILLAPEITLHPYHVQWKFFNGDQLAVLDVICTSVSFCQNVHCWFCTAHIFNPECSPRTAIIVSAILLYLVIAAIYLFRYVLIVVGKPIRILSKILRNFLRAVMRLIANL